MYAKLCMNLTVEGKWGIYKKIIPSNCPLKNGNSSNFTLIVGRIVFKLWKKTKILCKFKVKVHPYMALTARIKNNVSLRNWVSTIYSNLSKIRRIHLGQQ